MESEMMKQFLVHHVRMAAVSVCSLFMLVFLAACSGVGTTTTSTSNGTTTSTTTITGVVQSVDAAHHTVTVNVSGQTFTVSNLSDAQIAALQGRTGKTYKFVVTSAGNNTYTINSNNTSDVQSDDNGTQSSNNEPTATPQSNSVNVPGSIDFYGKVQSVNASNIVVAMPNSDTLSMSITAATDRGDFATTLPGVHQLVKVTAIANADGSFTAKKLDAVKIDDANNPTKMGKVDFKAVTTRAVGADNVVHFQVGKKPYSYTIVNGAEVKDFANAQAIGANQHVKVEVQFNGSNGSITQIKSDNGD
jgi:hypothetical protein